MMHINCVSKDLDSTSRLSHDRSTLPCITWSIITCTSGCCSSTAARHSTLPSSLNLQSNSELDVCSCYVIWYKTSPTSCNLWEEGSRAWKPWPPGPSQQPSRCWILQNINTSATMIFYGYVFLIVLCTLVFTCLPTITLFIFCIIDHCFITLMDIKLQQVRI